MVCCLGMQLALQVVACMATKASNTGGLLGTLLSLNTWTTFKHRAHMLCVSCCDTLVWACPAGLWQGLSVNCELAPL